MASYSKAQIELVELLRSGDYKLVYHTALSPNEATYRVFEGGKIVKSVRYDTANAILGLLTPIILRWNHREWYFKKIDDGS